MVRRQFLLLVIATLVAALLLEQTRPAVAVSLFTVDSTGDAGDAAPGDGTCATAGAVCTLRAAIQEANALGGADVIEFNIGAGTPVIQPATPLPTVTETVTINGNTGGATRVMLDGSAVAFSPGMSALRLATTGSNVNHLVVSDFNGFGIYLEGGGSNQVSNSYIGTDATGTIAIGNGNLAHGAIHVTSSSNLILSNVISGNATGVRLQPGADANTLSGNIIGLNPSQTAVVTGLPGGIGGGIGVLAIGDGNLIGLPGFGNGNTISAMEAWGIAISGNNNTVDSNTIGLDGPTASIDFGNLLHGVFVSSGTGNIIGSAAGQNLISGNGQDGIRIITPNTTVRGNAIGYGSLALPFPNGGAGIHVEGAAATGQVIEANNLWYNSGPGILVSANAGSPSAVRISQNSHYSNGGLGIDLSAATSTGDGVTLNDSSDADTGSNNFQNFPVLTLAKTNGSTVYVDGTLSTIPSSGTYYVELFGTPACDGSGYGEGSAYLGTSTVVIGAGVDTATFAFSAPSAIPVGYAVTATSWRAPTSDDTSEFSLCMTLTACAGSDGDCDGFLDVAPTTHQGPANTNTAVDNCIGLHNSTQANLDGNYTDTTPPLTQDDTSRPRSDAEGDACDIDADGDIALDSFELSLPDPLCPGASAQTSILRPDSDGDAYIDTAECQIGTDPGNPASKPTAAQCATLAGAPVATDTDGDKILDRIEVCGYSTSTVIVDTDGDGRRDGCEVGSLNTAPAVNSGDQLLLAQAITLDLFGPFVYNADLNKDGANSSGDQLLLAQIITGGLC